MQTIKHKADGREFEIRTKTTENGPWVGIFYNDRLIRSFGSADAETASDFETSNIGAKQSLRDEMIQIAKDDIDSGNIFKVPDDDAIDAAKV